MKSYHTGTVNIVNDVCTKTGKTFQKRTTVTPSINGNLVENDVSNTGGSYFEIIYVIYRYDKRIFFLIDLLTLLFGQTLYLLKLIQDNNEKKSKKRAKNPICAELGWEYICNRAVGVIYNRCPFSRVETRVSTMNYRLTSILVTFQMGREKTPADAMNNL